MSYWRDLRHIKTLYDRTQTNPGVGVTDAEYEEWRLAFNRVVAVKNRNLQLIKRAAVFYFWGMTAALVGVCWYSAYDNNPLLSFIASLSAASNFYWTLTTLPKLTSIPPHAEAAVLPPKETSSEPLKND